MKTHEKRPASAPHAAALPAARTRARRWLCVFAPLAAACFAGCAFAGLGHAWWLGILAASTGTAALWQLLKWQCLCQAEQYLEKRYRRALATALACPVWAALWACALALFNSGEAVESAGYWMFVLEMMFLLPALLLAALVLAVVSLVLSARHLKDTTEADSRLYRELPLALSGFLLAALVTTLGMLALYLLA